MTYQLKITLKGIKPLVWRRVLVPANTSLAKLHDIIQVAMGWFDYHFHEFEIHGKKYRKKSKDLKDEYDQSLSARKFKIKDLLKIKNKFYYAYDFGDDWQHDILVEKILDESHKKPSCIKAVGICPQEDSGGLCGYYEHLKILSDPKHPEYREVKRFIGKHYDQKIDLAEINERLESI